MSQGSYPMKFCNKFAHSFSSDSFGATNAYNSEMAVYRTLEFEIIPISYENDYQYYRQINTSDFQAYLACLCTARV